MLDGIEQLQGIREVADSLGITPRTLRLYEDRGLIAPRRVGELRVYSRRETTRMRRILRAKRLGFSLRQIRELLALYDADPRHVGEMRGLAERCRERIEELRAQKIALELTLDELVRIEREALTRNVGVDDRKR